ncbi:MAG TPA: sugar ABC transporter permease, partial [Thermomicrobiales bacterium]|nr:sugar ABC transporter permease [Thermomicrobiales bacterium]
IVVRLRSGRGGGTAMSAATIQVAGTSQAKAARVRADRLWAIFFIAPQVIGLVAFALVPLVFSFVLAFMQWDGLGDRAWVGFANFQEQFTDPEFLAALRNTLYFTVLTVPTGLALALLVALGVNRIRGKMVYRAFYFAPVVTSSVAISVVWQYLLNGQFGVINAGLRGLGLDPPNWLLDTRFVLPAIAVVTIWWTLGLNVVIFLAGLQNVPVVLQEAARTDGANGWRVFRDVTLPLLSPTIFFSVVIAVISSFQTFDQIFVLTNGGPLDASRTLVYHIYDLAFRDFAFGKSSAAALLLFVLTLIVTLVQFGGQRRWVHYG